ncbi:MAG: B12-binding domain-containing radical SAM protein, partial [Verrucomicrobia bacterium]|nr:B12-binding domain-containing radical SAM protein [Verrucomicrobiota bacterium]
MADPEIILTTLNAKYIHAAFGLRYLLANLGPLREQAEIIEFEIGQRTFPIVEQLLAGKPKIIGFGVYIWNVSQTLSVLKCLKKLAPEIKVVLGGPEVSYEIEGQEIAQFADVLITGEADLTFAGVCREIVDDGSPSQALVRSPVPDLSEIVTPYDLYSEDDVQNR